MLALTTFLPLPIPNKEQLVMQILHEVDLGDSN